MLFSYNQNLTICILCFFLYREKVIYKHLFYCQVKKKIISGSVVSDPIK
jgi:hypothetical protein